MRYSLISISLLALVMPYTAWGLFNFKASNRYTSQVMLRAGKTQYSKKVEGEETHRLNVGHLGYDLQFGQSNIPKMFPFFIIKGHKVFYGQKDLKSSSIEYGPGMGLEIGSNYRLVGQLTRKHERLVGHFENWSIDQKTIFYKLKFLVGIPILLKDNYRLYLWGGGGIFYPEKLKGTDLKYGYMEIASLKLDIVDKESHLESFVSELIGQQEIFKGSRSTEERKLSIILRSGKSF